MLLLPFDTKPTSKSDKVPKTLGKWVENSLKKVEERGKLNMHLSFSYNFYAYQNSGHLSAQYFSLAPKRPSDTILYTCIWHLKGIQEQLNVSHHLLISIFTMLLHFGLSVRTDVLILSGHSPFFSIYSCLKFN